MQVMQVAQAVGNTVVVDFLRPSAITTERSNYWDPVHYRVPVADRLMAELAAAAQGKTTTDGAVLIGQ